MSELQTIGHEHEVLVPLDQHEAQRLDSRVRLMAGATRSNFEKLGRILDEAKRGQVHEALGFKSWPAYVADAVGGQLQLSGESRQAMVQLMAGEGMSERGIADALGASKTTVHRDLEQVVQNGPPEPEAEVVHNGPPENDGAAESSAPDKVTGIDGKTYTKPKRKPKPKGDKPPAPKRRPNVRKGFQHMALQVGGWTDGLKDMDPAELVVDEEVQKEIDAVVEGLAAVRKFLDGVKPARKPQLLTVVRAAVVEIHERLDTIEALPADPRWPKAVARLNAHDRISVGKAINRLTEFHAPLVAAGRLPASPETHNDPDVTSAELAAAVVIESESQP